MSLEPGDRVFAFNSQIAMSRPDCFAEATFQGIQVVPGQGLMADVLFDSEPGQLRRIFLTDIRGKVTDGPSDAVPRKW